MAKKPRQKRGVTATIVAKHLDLTRPRVGQMVDEGVLSRLPDGSFELDGCRVAYIRWLRNERQRSTKAAAASRVSDARAREIELRVAKEENRLIELGEHDAVVDEAFGILKARLVSVPARVTRDVTLRQKIETEIDDALRACAERLEQAAADLASSGEAVAPVDEDDT